jgi:hypothetical protein
MFRTKTVQDKDSTMKIKINSIETRTGEKAGKFIYAKVDVLKNDGTVLENRTLMAFDKARESVKGFMKAGRTVTVQAIFKKNTILVLGQDKAKAKPAAAAA